LYAFRVHDGTGYGPYDQLPDGQFSVGGLSFHAPLIGRWGIGDPIRVRATYEVINWLFDQR
jgi:hypothetical protein